MALVVILLIFSVGLNIALVLGLARKRSDEDMTEIRLRESLRVE